MTLADMILADFQAEAPLTLAVLEAVPEDRFDFQPHPKSWKLAQLAGHVAEGPSFAGAMMEPELDFAQGGGDWKPFVPTSTAELLERTRAVHGMVSELLRGKDDAFLKERWVMRAGPKVLWETTRAEGLRSMTIHHTIHHRGQLEVYLRLVDAPLPPIYGPTADVPDLK